MACNKHQGKVRATKHNIFQLQPRLTGIISCLHKLSMLVDTTRGKNTYASPAPTHFSGYVPEKGNVAHVISMRVSANDVSVKQNCHEMFDLNKIMTNALLRLHASCKVFSHKIIRVSVHFLGKFSNCVLADGFRSSPVCALLTAQPDLS